MVGNGEIPIQNGSNRRDDLVDGSHPTHAGPVFDEPLPIVGEGHPAAPVEAGVVGGHDHRNGGIQALFQGQKGRLILLQQHVVGVQPHAVVHGRMGKGLVPGGGKVVTPGEVIDLIGKAAGDLFRAVGGAGVYNNDLVHQIHRAFQAALQHVLLIFYDHTQADAYHSGTSFDSLSPAPAGFRRRGQYFSGPALTRTLSLSRSRVRRPRSVSHSTGRSHPAG